MSKSKGLWALLGLAVLGVAWYFLSAITLLTNDDPFVSKFNGSAPNVRMVLLLSPT